MKSKLTVIKLLTVFILSTMLLGCTGNEMARRYGGTEEVQLKPNEKLVNITWKESSLWILTEDTTTHIKYFREKSALGITEGEVIIK
jgi:hypothetical protein